jgi:hypothetical protein
VMPEKKATPYTWLYANGGGEVPATYSKAARLVRDEKGAALLLRAVVKQVGLVPALRLLAEVAAEGELAEAEKKGGKK